MSPGTLTNSAAATARRRLPRALADLPIKRKLMLIIIGVTAAALLISGIGFIVFDLILFQGFLRRDLSALARITAENSTAALSFDDPASAEQTLYALRARRHVAAACVYRENGDLFARYARDGAQEPCPGFGRAGAVRRPPRHDLFSHYA
jgi:hypothetical protein